MTKAARKPLMPPSDIRFSQPGTMSKQKHPPLLVPVTENDASTLAQITVNATRTDLFNMVSTNSPAESLENISTFIRTALSKPSWAFVKALDPENQDKIIGWGATDVRESDWAEQGQAPGAEEKEEKQKERKLRKVVEQYEIAVRKKWLTGKRWLYMCAIFVEPSYQAGGIGSAIMAWAEKRADKERVVAFLQNLAGARGFYEARGWHGIDGMDLDLNEWANEKAREKGGNLGYGIYSIGYRLRIPSERRKEESGSVEQPAS